MISPEQMNVLSSGGLAEAPARTPGELSAFTDLNRRVTVEAEVAGVVPRSRRWQIELESETGRCWLDLPRDTTNTDLSYLHGAVVRAQGVCAKRVFDRGDSVEPTLMVQSAEDLEILRPGHPAARVDPDSLPVVSIGALMREAAASRTNGLVHLRGLVLDQQLGEHLLVRDETGTVLARSTQMTAVEAQQPLDIWGTPSWDGNRLEITKATYRPANRASTNTLAAPRQKPAELPVLIRARDLLELAPEEAAWRYPLRLRGVVTFSYPPRRQVYIQDETAGVFLSGQANRLDLKPGDFVEVTGVSDPGTFSPTVNVRSVTALGTAAMPEARKATSFQLAGGHFDGQWIEARGVVRSLALADGLLKLKVNDPDGALFVNIPAESAPTNLLDAVVRIHGVCSAKPNANRQITSLSIWVPSLEFLLVEDAGAPNPFLFGSANCRTQPVSFARITSQKG